MGKYSEDVSLIDVCPFSLGIAIATKKDDTFENMLMSKIIRRGSKLPCKKKKNLILMKIIKNQFFLEYMKEKNYTLKIIIFQGNLDYVKSHINKSNWNSLIIKNDKGGLSRYEIEEARLKHAKEKIGNDL